MAKEGSKDHITGAVREMFPKIPEDDLSAIVNHAFEEVNIQRGFLRPTF
jgi:hypothetical protein